MDIIINFGAVVVATVANYLFGWLWHGPLFGALWMRLSGITKDSMKSMPLTAGQAMTIGFVTTLLMTYVLAHFAAVWGVMDVGSALELAFWIWFGFAMTTLAGGWLWEGKSFRLFAFNAVYALISLMITAVVLSFWM
jgi:hypothetical protein